MSMIATAVSNENGGHDVAYLTAYQFMESMHHDEDSVEMFTEKDVSRLRLETVARVKAKYARQTTARIVHCLARACQNVPGADQSAMIREFTAAWEAYDEREEG